VTDKAQRVSTLLGTMIISFIGITLISNSVLIAIGSPVSGLTIPFAVILAICVAWWPSIQHFGEHYRRLFLIICVSFIILFALTILISSAIYDISFDGQTYHSEAIIGLAQGWNPFRMPVPVNAFYADWVGFFSKGPWITAAAMYRFTDNIESGKAFNSLLLIASGLFSYSALSTFPQLNRRWRLNLSILIALNPISVCQLFTFYVDGQLASGLIILISLLIILSQQQERILLIALASLLVVVLNIKLTGILYAGIILSGFVLWYGWQHRKQAVPVVACCVFTSTIGVIGVGYNPIISQFTRNLIDKGDPFYPKSWSQLIAIDRNMPQNFVGKDRFWKFGVSLFSSSQVDMQPTRLKIPFTVSLDDLFVFRYPDVRTGGFGPLFSGVLLLTLVIFIIGIAKYARSIYTGFVPILLVLIVISVLSTSEAWWARYAPQLWIVPILVVAINIRQSSKVMLRSLIGVWALVLALNVIMVASVSIIAIIRDQPSLRMDYDNVKQIEKDYGVVPLVLNAFPITQARFTQQNITFTLPEKLPCDAEHQHTLIFSWSIICNFGAQSNSK
jgi:hypothetical protein